MKQRFATISSSPCDSTFSYSSSRSSHMTIIAFFFVVFFLEAFFNLGHFDLICLGSLHSKQMTSSCLALPFLSFLGIKPFFFLLIHAFIFFLPSVKSHHHHHLLRRLLHLPLTLLKLSWPWRIESFSEWTLVQWTFLFW